MPRSNRWSSALPAARAVFVLGRPFAIGILSGVCALLLGQPWLFAQTPDGPRAKEVVDIELAANTEDSTDERSTPRFSTELLSGRVVWQADALKSEFNITTVQEVSENVLTLVTDEGRLYPLVENIRGRAFRKDERLRDIPLQILARVYEKQPFVQILKIYQVIDEKRFEIDYWCDVCAIVMFETGACACCQDDNRLRKTLVEEEVRSAQLDSEK